MEKLSTRYTYSEEAIPEPVEPPHVDSLQDFDTERPEGEIQA
jgi:hypothetical protein